MINITEKQFDELYTPVKNHLADNASFEGCMFETYGPELDYVIQMAKENRVVTILESESEEDEDNEEPSPDMYYASGFHYINRIGYFILDKPYDEDFEVKIDW